MLKDQADQAAEALLHGARRGRRAPGNVPDFPELRAWPAEGRAAVWRGALQATRWDWPVILTIVVAIIPSLVLLVLAALSLSRLHVGHGSLPIFLSLLTPAGILAIRRVQWSRARRYLRVFGSPPGLAG
jgi:hypothetical protein